MKRLAIAALLVACTSPTVTRSGAAEDGTYAMATDVDPRAEARVALARDAWRRQERMLDALDPGRALASTRLEDDEIAAGLVAPRELFAIGGELFHHRFLPSEGAPATLSRFEDGTHPAARSCASCHLRGGAAGGGSSVDVAYEGGDGVRWSSAVQSRPPSLIGGAWLELVAREMTRELAALRDATRDLAHARGRDVTVELVAHGVSFGSLTVHADGSVASDAIRGVGSDLIVRPFARYGSLASAIDGELARRLGVALGTGQRAALVTYLALLAPPIEELPTTSDYALSAARGRSRFDALGCSSCHVAELVVSDATYDVGLGVSVSLDVDGEPPRIARDALDGRLVVRAYTDLRRHAMGAALADAETDTFVTPALWGLAARAPYLHDARAGSVEDAIMAHGGEAQSARDAYAALADVDRGDLRMFLATLTRARRLEVP